MNSRIEGLVAAPFTPFKADGKINFDIIGEYLCFLSKNGVVGAFVNGSTGEGVCLTLKERLKTAEKWMENVVKDFKVLIHVGSTSVEDVKIMAKHAQDIGAYAIGSVGPYYFKPSTVEQLVDHVAIEASAAPNLPYYYYHIPVLSGVKLPMSEFLMKAKDRIPNLAGIKYTDETTIDDYNRCKRLEKGKFDILWGKDEILLSALVMEAKGAIGSTYNYAAPLYTNIIKAFTEGNMEKAFELQSKSIDLVDVLRKTGSFLSGGKSIMKFLGLDMGIVRSPIPNITKKAEKELQSDLEKLGFSEFSSK